MRKLRDFVCGAGHKFEAFVNDEVHVMQCKECAELAKRQLSAPMGKGNFAHGILKK